MIFRLSCGFTALASLVSACAAPFAETGSDDSCGDLGCQNSLTIGVERRDGEPFVAGDYAFRAAFEDREETASCTVGPGDELRCETGQALEVSLDARSYSFSLRLRESPAVLTVRVQFGEEPLFSEEVVPEYQLVSPGGPSCQPTCLQGQELVLVDPPRQEL